MNMKSLFFKKVIFKRIIFYVFVYVFVFLYYFNVVLSKNKLKKIIFIYFHIKIFSKTNILFCD